MKKMIKKTLMAAMLAASSIPALASASSDSLWIRFDNRFKDNRFIMSLEGIDSIEFRASSNTSPIPIIRRYSDKWDKGYADYRLNNVVGNADGAALVVGNPGLILWKPTTSDANYNNDYKVDTNRWCFKHSQESEHFVVFWDKTFGELSSTGKVTGSVSKLTVSITDLLAKAEKFYKTNVEKLKMCVTGKGQSQLDHYKILIYLIDQTEWLATGSGSDNKIGTLWVSPNTCQPVGSTIAHEIGHSFQYQTYCDNILQGKRNDMHSGFRYGYPNSNGGCGFWEQCAQWQSFQNYPSEAINSYHFNVWISHCHRHFEHEWQRYASYWEHYYWSEKNGMDALGRIWNESAYPEDANQAYMRIFLDNDYNTLRKQLFEYAQHAATFDFNAIRNYVGTAYNSYNTRLYTLADGWKQISYAQCPQPTGINVIPYTNGVSQGRKIKVTLRALPAGSDLASIDPGKIVNGDGPTGETTTTYNKTAIAGHEGLAFGFVALKTDGTREYGEMNIATTAEDAVATFTIPERTSKVFIVVQGSPDKYFQCPWDEKETTDNQCPYMIKIE